MMYESPPIPLLALRTVTYCTENEWTPRTIERLFAWEDKFRRLLFRFERIVNCTMPSKPSPTR